MLRTKKCLPHTAIGLFYFFCMLSAFAQNKPTSPDFEKYDWLRGSGDDLEMRLHGKVKSATTASLRDLSVSVAVMDSDNHSWFEAKTSDSSFEVWLPVNRVR